MLPPNKLLRIWLVTVTEETGILVKTRVSNVAELSPLYIMLKRSRLLLEIQLTAMDCYAVRAAVDRSWL